MGVSNESFKTKDLQASDLRSKLSGFFELAARKIPRLCKNWNDPQGSPVFTVKGKYTTRGWTEWTRGFLFGSALLGFEATGDEELLKLGQQGTSLHMAPYLTHRGVHDHGFNIISTYGNLLRLLQEGKIEGHPWQREFYALALKVSGAVQAGRWTALPQDLGYIYSFNGPHSLFADTVRTLRVLALSHILGHCLLDENDCRINLLRRALQHLETTARYTIYWGQGRDRYDQRGRVAHESIFNIRNGTYRCPNSQQGYSPFTTWTRGLAWIICGYAEQLEFIVDKISEQEISALKLDYYPDKQALCQRLEEATRAVCDYYIQHTPPDGVPYWDTGPPNIEKIPNRLETPADPHNPHEPVDSSAAAIAAQGLLRAGTYFGKKGDRRTGSRYYQEGLKIAATLFQEPYLSTHADHQGLILHSVYHFPNGWDHSGKDGLPRGESSMWGDYHALELAVYLQREMSKDKYLRFDAISP